MIKLKIQKDYNGLKNKIDYVFDNFNQIYNVKNDISIFYGDSEDESNIQIIPGENVFEFFQNEIPIPENHIVKEWNNKSIPFMFSKDSDTSINIIDYSTNKIKINFDIILSGFYFLSSWQEWYSDDVDKYGRFPAQNHLLYKLDILQIPVVNYYFDILFEAIKTLDNASIELRNEKMKTIISHDIDECKTGWIFNSYWYLKDGKPFNSLKIILNKIFKKDVWFNFDKIMEVEKELNVNASFFFITRKEEYKNIKNADYEFNSVEIKDVIEKLETNGHEVGLHGSFGTGLDYKMLQDDIERFNAKVIGGRFHYLAIEIPKTYDILEQAKLSYDSSLGFADSIGFRSGFCFPYYPYNIKKDCSYSFLEFPLSVMDITLENKQYMNCSVENAVETLKPIINEINKFKGVLVLLWHNKFFTGYKSIWRNVFEEILTYCKTQNTEFKIFKNFLNDPFEVI